MQSIISLLPQVGSSSIRSFVETKQNLYPADWFYRPVGIEVEITNKCNLKCAGCGQRDQTARPADLLTTEEYIRVIRQLKGTPIFACSITGGETLLFLERVKEIITGINDVVDIYKINSNSYRFVSDEATQKVLRELKQAGFGQGNQYIKAVLVTSIGQQNENGMPLKNSVYLVKNFYTVFDFERTLCTVNSTDRNLQRSNYWLREFKKLYFEMTNTEVDQHKVPFRCFMLNNVPTLKRLGLMVNYELKISELIESFHHHFKSWKCLNQLPVDANDEVTALTPRCLLQPNGDLYACPGYNYTHLIGNVREQSVWEILTQANQDPILRVMFTGGLAELFEYSKKFLPNISKEKLSLSYGPCDVCQHVSKQLRALPARSLVV